MFVGELPIYARGVYEVWVGYLTNDKDNDIPHYLIVNVAHNVVEAGSAVLVAAMSSTDQLHQQLVNYGKEEESSDRESGSSWRN